MLKSTSCFSFRNSICELSTPLCLPEIKLLDVSRNRVENIAPDFLTGCPKLEVFNASTNKISEWICVITLQK